MHRQSAPNKYMCNIDVPKGELGHVDICPNSPMAINRDMGTRGVGPLEPPVTNTKLVTWINLSPSKNKFVLNNFSYYKDTIANAVPISPNRVLPRNDLNFFFCCPIFQNSVFATIQINCHFQVSQFQKGLL